MDNNGGAIDPEAFASLVDIIGPEMPEMVAEILDTYMEESDDLLDLVDAALESNQLDEMLRPVHSLKSSSASVGATKLSATCAEVEQFLRGNDTDLDLEAYVQRIHTGYRQAKAELIILRDEYAAL